MCLSLTNYLVSRVPVLYFFFSFLPKVWENVVSSSGLVRSYVCKVCRRWGGVGWGPGGFRIGIGIGIGIWHRFTICTQGQDNTRQHKTTQDGEGVVEQIATQLCLLSNYRVESSYPRIFFFTFFFFLNRRRDHCMWCGVVGCGAVQCEPALALAVDVEECPYFPTRRSW